MTQRDRKWRTALRTRSSTSNRLACRAGAGRLGRVHELTLGGPIGGGLVEHETEHAYWLPYVEVADIDGVVGRALQLGASTLLEPREGPAGWRSVLAAPDGGMCAVWQPKP
ncbi:MAG TPA: hypothetical protein VE615_06950 [Gaiellaceae bacterium]|jgi:predicted enzyme related to lactoylglutathione lyase|nr:hypothetical protein [Gaiellaceae bacterium]